DQRLGRRPILQLTLALGAYQNLEQLRREAHADSSSAVGNPNRERAAALRRHLGNTFTHVSRYTGAPINSSRRVRACAPIALIVWPPRPITMAFCDSRSTKSVTRMYTGRSASRNSSTSAVKA